MWKINSELHNIKIKTKKNYKWHNLKVKNYFHIIQFKNLFYKKTDLTIKSRSKRKKLSNYIWKWKRLSNRTTDFFTNQKNEEGIFIFMGLKRKLRVEKETSLLRGLNGWFYDCGHAKQAFVVGYRLY